MKHVLSLLLFVSFALLSKAELDPILEMVKLDDVPALRSRLEENPSSLEATGPFGQTPLLRAVLLGSKGAVQALLELGADAMATETTGGYNVLHAAGFQGRAEVLEILIDHFASAEPGKKLNLVSDQHEDGFYPIHRACWGREPRHAETLRVMLKHGVPYDLAAENGKTCEMMTTNQETLKVLSEAKQNDEL